MVSDHYALKPQPEAVSKILDITEHMAACYGFEENEIMRIRLLTEEMIISVHSGLILVPAEIWFSAKGGVFTVTASVSTDVHGMPKERRKKLLNAFKAPKKSGLFGVIQSFMDDMVLAEEDMSLYNYLNAHYYDGHAGLHFGMPFDSLSMDSLYQLYVPAPAERDEKKNDGESDEERDLEINLLKGFADDIRVTNRFGTLEMSVMKRIPKDFMAGYILDDSEVF